MLTNQMQINSQLTSLTTTSNYFQKSFLNVSYDLNNYHSLLSTIQEDDDPRWILFIAPPGKPNFSFLQAAGIAVALNLATLGETVKEVMG